MGKWQFVDLLEDVGYCFSELMKSGMNTVSLQLKVNITRPPIKFYVVMEMFYY